MLDPAARTRLGASINVLIPFVKEDCQNGNLSACPILEGANDIRSQVETAARRRQDSIDAVQEQKLKDERNAKAEAEEKQLVARERETPQYRKCVLMRELNRLSFVKKEYEGALSLVQEDNLVIGYVSVGNQAAMNQARRGLNEVQKRETSINNALSKISDVRVKKNFCEKHLGSGKYPFAY